MFGLSPLLIKLIVGGLLLLTVGGLGWSLKNSIKQNAILEMTLEAKDAETNALLKQHEKEVAALELVIEKETARVMESNKLLETINESKESDDGPVAPVLNNLLDQLRNPKNDNKDSNTTSP